jgi:hypothetical protein
MITVSRTDKILIDANFPEVTELFEQCASVEFDTSCPHVPFGFVKVVRARLNNSETPDRFWASCIASDQQIDCVVATIEEFQPPRLASLTKVLREDLARVDVRETVDLPALEQIQECFALENGCKYCGGKILLIKTKIEAFYVHWHRES